MMEPKLKRIFKEKIKPRSTHFDSSSITIFEIFILPQALLLFYFVKNPFSLGAAIFDNMESQTLLWQSINPIWQTHEPIKLQKIIYNEDQIKILFTLNGKLKDIFFNLQDIFPSPNKIFDFSLERTLKNPILCPKPNNTWETTAVFNAGTLYLENKVHIVYRAIKSSGESVFGYASSKDGLHIDWRSDSPIYACNLLYNEKFSRKPIPYHYHSGGSWSGCEDPRLTCIEDTIYMTYTSFNSFQPPFVALTSIAVSDFINRNWCWSSPIRISKRGEIHKNWVIFPEKINGKFAVLHSLTPKILVKYIDTFQSSVAIKSHYQSEINSYWDNWTRGAGPPPIKTKEGWLLLYHAMDTNDPDKYKLGAMILDFKDPRKVRYRSAYPILEPCAKYEREGLKPNVVYCCGTATIEETLYVYYGAADTVLCAAYISLSKLLQGIKYSQAPLMFEFCKWE